MFKRKPKLDLTPPPEAENTLYLNIDNDSEMDVHSLEFMKWNPHDKDYEGFMPIACDAMEHLFSGMTSVSYFENYAIQKPQKKLFLKEKSAQYSSDDHTNKILSYIRLHPEEQCIFWESYRNQPPNINLLCVAKEDITAQFIKNAYINTFVDRYKHTGYELLIDGYMLNRQKPTKSVIENINNDVSIYYDATHTALSICCNITNYPIEKLISILTEISEKHGKRLEINL